MRTLLLTDLHLTDKPKGHLKAQVECINRIIWEEKPNEIIFMGDIFMYRKPSPSVLLAFQTILRYTEATQPPFAPDVYILRGNHDSETKADDGVTALSVFETKWCKIITHVYTDEFAKRVYIPHYEDERKIVEALEEAPEGYTVFGHFGYVGSLNSAGDHDFNISLNKFHNTSFLGHIHKFTQKTIDVQGSVETLTVLGTPYTTNFGEAFKDSFYAILETDKEPEFKRIEHGPRHLVIRAQDIEDKLELINDPNYFTMLRVVVDVTHEAIPTEDINVAYIDTKYTPLFNDDDISTFCPDRDLFTINEVIIEDYVDGANSTISKEELMRGYRLLRDEN